jgi:hypothetical protein
MTTQSITTPKAMSEKEAIDKLQQLKEKERTLNEKLIRMKAESSSVSKELDALKADARAEFGTDNLEELRALYRKNMEENSASIIQFSKGLEDIELILGHVESQLKELDQQGA